MSVRRLPSFPIWAMLHRWLGVGLFTITFAASLAVAVWNTLSIERPNKVVVRIAHWQLERGYREALQAVIHDYEARHPDVRIEQSPLPENVYTQSINTQLISDTAPDLCEMGRSDLIGKDDNTVRYFLPLGTLLAEPNPYNRGTDLQDLPWKDTALDGMRSGYRDGLADYYGVPTTLYAMRLFYNKDLLKAATGSDAPPATFGQWMAACRQVRLYAATHDSRILPIVSCYGLSTMVSVYQSAFTASFESALDLNLDGDVSPFEGYIGFCRNIVTPQTPAVQAVYRTMRSIGEQMQQGFSAMDRQQAQYRFVNGLAAFMWSGSWDAGGTEAQARDKGFEVGIMRPPLPAGDEPLAAFVTGQAAERAIGGGVYGVAKASRNQAVAIDFLRYLTSRDANEKFNRLAQWPPATRGARPSDLMRPFSANPSGVASGVGLAYGSRVGQDLAAEEINFLQGTESLDVFVAAVDRLLRDPRRGGDWAWWNEFNQRQGDLRAKENVMAQQQLLGLLDPNRFDTDRYRRLLLQQVLRNDAKEYLYLFQKYRGRPMPQF